MLSVYGHEHYALLQLIQPVGYHRPSATVHDFQSLYFIKSCETHSFAMMVESLSMKWSIQKSLNAMHGNLPIGYTICFGPNVDTESLVTMMSWVTHGRKQILSIL